MVTVNEYLQLKNRLANLKSSAKTVKSKERALSIQNNIIDVEQHIKNAETQEDVTTYLSLIKKKQRLQQTIGARKFYKKDVSQLETQLNEVLCRIDELKKVPIPQPSVASSAQPIQTDALERLEQSVSKLENIFSEVAPVSNNSICIYYSINLAWTFIADIIHDPVVDFMKMSNYISVKETPNTITWKFAYDTVEEKAHVKSLQTCAAHLLEVLKNMNSSWKSDAEVFGKIQQY